MATVESRLFGDFDSSTSSSDPDDEQYNDNETQSTYNDTELLVALQPSLNSDPSCQSISSTPSRNFYIADGEEEVFDTSRSSVPSPVKRPLIDTDINDLDAPPIKKSASPNSLVSLKSNRLPRTSLSRSADSVELQSAIKKVRANLNRSCFADYRRGDDGDIDSDLRCLSWLQEGNLLNGFNPSASSSKSIAVKSEPESNANKHNYDPELLLNSSDPLNVISDVDKTLQKPPYSFSTLIFMAIENSESKMLAVKDIYQWIQDTFPYFQKASIGWKNSVRHNLSLNKSFKKVEKVKCIGKGSLWAVDHEARAGLVQQLRKSSAYHSYQNYQCDRSPLKNSSHSKYLKFGLPYGKRDASGRFLPNHDEAEFDVAAAMCSLSTSPRASAGGRFSDSSSSFLTRTSPDLLSMWRSHVEPYDYSSEDSDDDKSVPSELNGFRPIKVEVSLSQILDEVRTQDLLRSGRAHLIRPCVDRRVDVSVDGDYEFDDTDSHDESDDDDVMHLNMKRLIARENDDALADSGYAEEGFYRAVALWDHTYSKSLASLVKPKHKNEMKGLTGLLHLARAASKELESLNRSDKRSDPTAAVGSSDQLGVSLASSRILQESAADGPVLEVDVLERQQVIGGRDCSAESSVLLSSAMGGSSTVRCQGVTEKLDLEKRLCTLDELARVSTLHGAIHAC